MLFIKGRKVPYEDYCIGGDLPPYRCRRLIFHSFFSLYAPYFVDSFLNVPVVVKSRG